MLFSLYCKHTYLYDVCMCNKYCNLNNYGHSLSHQSVCHESNQCDAHELQFHFFFSLSFSCFFSFIHSFIIHGKLSLFELIENGDWRDSWNILCPSLDIHVFQQTKQGRLFSRNSYFTYLIECSDRRHSSNWLTPMTRLLCYALIYFFFSTYKCVAQFFSYCYRYFHFILDVNSHGSIRRRAQSKWMYPKTIDKWYILLHIFTSYFLCLCACVFILFWNSHATYSHVSYRLMHNAL